MITTPISKSIPICRLKKKLILSKYLRKFQREKPQELQLGKIRSILQHPKISFEILQCMIIDTINHKMSWEKLGENADRSDKGEKKKSILPSEN